MVDINAHEAGNGGKKPREAYSLPSLLYSEKSRLGLWRQSVLGSARKVYSVATSNSSLLLGRDM
jgi:hypothetical protein